MYRLVFQSGRYEGKRIVVRQAVALAGRGDQCHLVLSDDDRMAKRHARFEENGIGVFVTALSADHPVFRNGEDILDATVRLAHGDLVELGRTRIQFQDIIAPHRRLRPSPGLLQPATGLLAIAILAFEIFLLGFLVDWPRLIIRPDTEARDLAHAERRRAEIEAAKASDTGTVAQASANTSVVAMPGSSSPSAATNAGASDDALQELEIADFVPADTNSTLAILPSVSAADTRIEQAQRLLAQATSAAEFADYPNAFRLLNQIHQTHPGFIPAHVQHAKLLETRGDLGGALQRWAIVLSTAPANSPARAQAQKERQRLSDLRDVQTRILEHPGVPDLDNLPRHVRIAASDVQRLPSDSDVAEMRVLALSLASPPNSPLYQNAVLQVFVTFYDVAPDGQPRPTRAITSPSPIVLNAPFAARQTLDLEATYVVPRSLRAQESREFGAPLSFYGYSIHVYAGQILQDAFAKPRKLLGQSIHFPAAEN